MPVGYGGYWGILRITSCGEKITLSYRPGSTRFSRANGRAAWGHARYRCIVGLGPRTFISDDGFAPAYRSYSRYASTQGHLDLNTPRGERFEDARYCCVIVLSPRAIFAPTGDFSRKVGVPLESAIVVTWQPHTAHPTGHTDVPALEVQNLSLQSGYPQETWVGQRCTTSYHKATLVSEVLELPRRRPWPLMTPDQGRLITTDSSQRITISILVFHKFSPQACLLLCICLCRLHSVLGWIVGLIEKLAEKGRC